MRSGKPDPNGKLPLKDKIIYSSCIGLGVNMAPIVFSYYLTYFYTDVLEILPPIASFILLGSRIFDTITDLIMGITIDRITLKSGKYRGWLKIASVPMFVGLVLIFAPISEMSDRFKIFWAILTYGTYGAIWNTMAYGPSNAMLVNMTQNVKERAFIVGFREVFYNIGVVIVASLFMPMVNSFGKGNEGMGFFFAAMVAGAVALLAQIFNLIIQRKYELDEDGNPLQIGVTEDKGKSKCSMFSEIMYLRQNKPAILILIGIFAMNILMTIKGSLMIYVFKYYFAKENFYSLAMAFFTISAIMGALFIQFFVRWFRGSNQAFQVILIANIVVNIMYFLMCRIMGRENASVSIQFQSLFMIFCVCGFLQGVHYGFPNLLLPSTIDYGYKKTGRLQVGLINGINSLCISLASAIGGFLTAQMLSAIGYVPNIMQSESTLQGILVVSTLLPVVLMAFQLILQMILRRYREVF